MDTLKRVDMGAPKPSCSPPTCPVGLENWRSTQSHLCAEPCAARPAGQDDVPYHPEICIQSFCWL